MATPTRPLIQALRETACTLDQPGVTYKWSHFAHCNCGHLVQTITGLAPADIQMRAILHERDWGQQAREHSHQPARSSSPPPDFGDRPALDEGAWEPENVGACQLTGLSLDAVFDTLVAMGLDARDVQHLERLSDPEVRRRLGVSGVDFPHHLRENVVRYLRAWADLLEEGLGGVSSEPRREPSNRSSADKSAKQRAAERRAKERVLVS